jgi:hypothetical protein
MKKETYLLIPSDPKLAELTCYWKEFRSLEAAEDAQDEYADRGLNYNVRPKLVAWGLRF